MSDLSSEGALVISCGTVTPQQVILHIIGVESPSEEVVEQNTNLKKFPWNFETKYYTAEINLFALKKKDELEAAFCDAIRAVVFYFDGSEESSFDEILSWMPYIKDIKAEVQLMVCNNGCDDSNYLDVRKKFLNWCIKNQYELVELNPSPDSDDEESSVKYAKGYDRVIEALQSHPWANLTVKSPKTDLSDAVKDLNITENIIAELQKNDAVSTNVESDCNSAEGGATWEQLENERCKHVVVEGEDLPLEEKLLNSVLSGEDPGGESLEALFGKFASMKERASGLSGAERKKYAEEVAVAFWKAMGGDEDEIEDLDDLED